jgi:hypothetical protein
LAFVGDPKLAWLYIGALGVGLAIPGLLAIFLLGDTTNKSMRG